MNIVIGMAFAVSSSDSMPRELGACVEGGGFWSRLGAL